MAKPNEVYQEGRKSLKSLMKAQMPAEEHRVMHYMLWHIGMNNCTWVSNDTLSREMDTTPRTIRRSLKNLTDRGYLEAEQRCRDATVYSVGRAYLEGVPWKASVSFMKDPRLTLIAQEATVGIPEKGKNPNKYKGDSASVMKFAAEPKEKKEVKKPKDLKKVWVETVPLIYPQEAMISFTGKEIGLFKIMHTKFENLKHDSGDVLSVVLENWIDYGWYVKDMRGLANFPDSPTLSFLVKYSDDMVNFYIKKKEVKEKPVVKAAPIPKIETVAPSQASKYKKKLMTAEDLLD